MTINGGCASTGRSAGQGISAMPLCTTSSVFAGQTPAVLGELPLKLAYIDDARAESAGEAFGPAEERIPVERGAIEHGPAMRGKDAGNVMQPCRGASQRAGLGGMRTHQVGLQLAQGAP